MASLVRSSGGRRLGSRVAANQNSTSRISSCGSDPGCWASSLVGARTKPSTLPESGSRLFSMGTPNAAVFPVPVWALARMSLPFSR